MSALPCPCCSWDAIPAQMLCPEHLVADCCDRLREPMFCEDQSATCLNPECGCTVGVSVSGFEEEASSTLVCEVDDDFLRACPCKECKKVVAGGDEREDALTDEERNAGAHL